MKSVLNNTNEYIIHKSRFIAITYQINSIDDVNEKLEIVKKTYKDATHYCYAYIFDNQEKSYDDKEPSGTAGNPILNVLKKENVNHVLCIVVRYFGGIKLGANGLVRAYTKVCKDCLKIIHLEEGYLITINFDYENIKQIDYLLKESIIVDKKYDTKLTYKIKIKKENYDNIYSLLNQISDIKINESIFI